ncbi:MAG: glycosyltransferase family 9 protein [Syntrophothermus sp.]
MSLIVKKASNLIIYLISVFFIRLIHLNKRSPVSGTLLIVKMDAIGDYVLFRNFLQEIRESRRFRYHRITLCGNVLWKELAETLDSSAVNEFIWIDKKRFYSDLSYKFSQLKNIYLRGFETAVSPTYSREILFDDIIIKAAAAGESAGSESALEKHAKWKRELFTNSVYTKKIKADTRNIFEFLRNMEFIENYLGEKKLNTWLSIDTGKIRRNNFPPEKYVVLFPGAGEPKRQWGIPNFIRTAQYILDTTSFNITIAGSKGEYALAQEITSALSSSRVYNLAGVTNLPEFAALLADAELLVSNETSAVHFAAAVGTTVICISNGGFLGRFHPYPYGIFAGAYYIYPAEIRNNKYLFTADTNPYRYGSDLSVNEIQAEEVISRIRSILQ